MILLIAYLYKQTMKNEFILSGFIDDAINITILIVTLNSNSTKTIK